MAKIKVRQTGGEVRISRAGLTATTYKVSGEGTITVRKDAVAEVLRLVPGAELVDGTLEDAVDESTLPASDVLPTEQELAAQREAEAAAAAKATPKRNQ